MQKDAGDDVGRTTVPTVVGVALAVTPSTCTAPTPSASALGASSHGTPLPGAPTLPLLFVVLRCQLPLILLITVLLPLLILLLVCLLLLLLLLQLLLLPHCYCSFCYCFYTSFSFCPSVIKSY